MTERFPVKLRILFLLATMMLTGCNSTGVKSEAPDPAAENTPETAVKPERKVTTKPMQPQGGEPVQKQSDMAALNGRLTAVQEQLFQLKTQAAEMQQQNQALFIHIQSIKDAVMANKSAATDGAEHKQVDVEAFNGVLDQLTLVANQLGNSVQDGQFKITSAYTSKGQWVLIRYDRFTGESWLADQGQWNLLEESGATGTSDYEVVVLRADNDVKGYVAARLDKINGDAWWLKQDIWQPFVTN
jgi:hypothetical protein